MCYMKYWVDNIIINIQYRNGYFVNNIKLLIIVFIVLEIEFFKYG